MNEDTTNHDSRFHLYKSNAYTTEGLRRKRREDEVKIRKQKRCEILDSRRNISDINSDLLMEPTVKIPQELIENLRCGKTNVEQHSFKVFDEQLSSNAWTISDLASSRIFSIMADVYCNKEPNNVVCGYVSRVYMKCANIVNTEIKLEQTDNYCIDSLVKILSDHPSSNAVTCDILQAFSCFLGKSVVYRNLALDSVFVPVLLASFEYQDVHASRCIMFVVSQIFQSIREYSPHVDEVAPLLDIIEAGMQSEDSSIQTDATRACAFLAEWPRIWEKLREHKLIPLLVNSLSNGVVIARPSVVRAIDFIMQTTNGFTQEMLDAGLLDRLKPIIHVRYLSKDICFILSNISTDGDFAVDRLIQTGVLQEVAKLLETSEYVTRKEAAYTIANCCSSTRREHIGYILDIGLLPTFTDLLTCMDAKLVIQILDALECLLLYGEINLSPVYTNPVAVKLEEIGCRQKLEFLTQSQNLDIHIKSYQILERFFDDDEVAEFNRCADEMRSPTTIDHAIEGVLASHRADSS